MESILDNGSIFDYHADRNALCRLCYMVIKDFSIMKKENLESTLIFI